MLKRQFLGLAVIAAGLGFAGPASAAVVSWTTGTFSTTAILPSASSVVYAVDIGNFSAPIAAAGITFGIDDNSKYSFTANSAANGGVSNTTSGDGNFDTLLSSFRFDASAGGGTTTGTLNGLTPGTTYSVLLLAVDTRASSIGVDGRTFSANNGSPSTDSSASQRFAFSYDTNPSGPLGGYILGQFTADAVTQTLNVVGPVAQDQLNALVLSTVPEPASLGLLCIGGLGLLARRRRT